MAAKRIVIVDDEPNIGLSLQLILEREGYLVVICHSAAEFRSRSAAQRAEAYLLDVRLPDGTGVELCQKLRELNSEIPILYYSAYGDEADHQKALQTCGDAYLKKPVCIADIQETIARLLAAASEDH